MKNSEKYHKAILAVLDSFMLPEDKLEIIERLVKDKIVAETCEKADEQANEVKE